MRHLLMTATLLLTAPALAGEPAPAPTPAPAAPASEQAARATFDRFIESWNRHDMKAFGALFTPNADFVNVYGMVLNGRPLIEEHHAFLHQGRFKDSNMTAEQVQVRLLRPDVALLHVQWKLTGDKGLPGEKAPPSETRGTATLVVLEQGGQWLITSVHNGFRRELPKAALPPSH